MRRKAMKLAADRIRTYMQHRVGGAIRTEAIIFSSTYGWLAQTEGAQELLKLLESEKERKEKE